MKNHLDKSTITIGTHKELEEIDKKYWQNATLDEKLKTITYLRECFYGDEATTGRLQRIYTVLKRE